jgi:flavin reductase (DIM6/NTAB) family NADH-FMN oxidoreductase RutF
VSHGGPKILGRFQPVLASQQRLLRRQFCAALTATSCEDRATSTGLHAKAEAVSLCSAAGVRLECALAHCVLLQNIWWVYVKIKS